MLLLGVICLAGSSCPQSGSGGSGGGSGNAPTIRSLSIAGQDELFAIGQQAAWTASEALSNGTTRDGTGSVTWKSSDISVATVGATGVVTAVAAGTAEISASIQGMSASATVAVEPPAWTLVGVPSVGQPDTTTHNVVVDPRDERLIYVGTQQGLYVTRDGGASWQRPLTGFAYTVRLDPSNPDRVYAVVGAGTLARSDDRGQSFVTLKTVDDILVSMAISPRDPQTIWLAYGGFRDPNPSGVLKTTDGGATWTRFTFGAPGALIPWDIRLDSTTGTLYAGTEIADHPLPYHPPFFTSPDGGQTWLDATGNLPWHVVSLAVDSSTHRVLALTEGAGLYQSTDFARTWTRVSSGTNATIAVDPREANRIFGGSVVSGSSSGGAFISADGGLHFTAYGLNGQTVGDLSFNGSSTRVYAASYGSGLYATSVRAPR